MIVITLNINNTVEFKNLLNKKKPIQFIIKVILNNIFDRLINNYIRKQIGRLNNLLLY